MLEHLVVKGLKRSNEVLYDKPSNETKKTNIKIARYTIRISKMYRGYWIRC